MVTRTNTKQCKIGNLLIGGQNKVLIQTMCNIKTEKVDEIIEQINQLTSFGCDLVRVSIKDEKDALALAKITKSVNVPIIADIHFNYKLAILSIQNGAAKIRINPGNIFKEDELEKVILEAKKYDVCIRIGVNSGSINQEFLPLFKENPSLAMIKSVEKTIKLCEKHSFDNIVLSFKGSNVLDTIKAYELAAETFAYPLHLGITEAGTKDISLVRSSAFLSPLLLKGIGDTIRISISGDPKDEVIAAKRLLHDLGLYPNYPTLISCPTCGRTEVDITHLSEKIADFLETINKNITVAVMGCVVNGPGEAKAADIGIAGGKNEYVLFKNGELIKKVSEDEAFETLVLEIKKSLV